MATLLIGYDTEAAAVGEGLARFIGPEVPQYRAALDPDVTRRGVALLSRLHEELGAPCTFFVCGRTLLHALDAIRAARRVRPLRHPAAHLQPRRLPRRALSRRGRGSRGGDSGDASRRAPRGASLHLRADPQVSRTRVHRAADAVRLLPGPARAVPTCSRSCTRPATASSPRGGATSRTGTPPPGCSRSPTPRRGSPTCSRSRSSSGSTGSGSTQTATARARRSAERSGAPSTRSPSSDLVFATAFHEWCAVEANEEGTGWIRDADRARARAAASRS